MEELDNLHYEIMPPSGDDADCSSVSGEQNAFSDFVLRHFMQRFSHLDLSRWVCLSHQFCYINED